MLSGTDYLGPNGHLVLSNIVDSGGIGPSHAECFWNGATNGSNHASGASLTPPSTSGSTSSYTLGCRIIDLLGNEGSLTWYNGSVDLTQPNVSISPSAGNTISTNTTLAFTVTDEVLASTSFATIYWSNSSSNWNTTVSFNGTWSGTLSSLTTGLTDGVVTVSVRGLSLIHI